MTSTIRTLLSDDEKNIYPSFDDEKYANYLWVQEILMSTSTALPNREEEKIDNEEILMPSSTAVPNREEENIENEEERKIENEEERLEEEVVDDGDTKESLVESPKKKKKNKRLKEEIDDNDSREIGESSKKKKKRNLKKGIDEHDSIELEGESSKMKKIRKLRKVIDENDSIELERESSKKKKNNNKRLKEETDNDGNKSVGQSSKNKKLKKKVDDGRESVLGKISRRFCGICMERKRRDEMFNNTNNCSHNFCSDCMSKYIAVKIQENNIWVTCPEPNCKETLEPHMCQTIIPEEVYDRWGNAICESLILGSQKFYCPFKDCSAMMVNDGEEIITVADCPHCRRVFCAQCKVPWHRDIECKEYQELNNDEREREGIMLINLAKEQQWKRCPNCKMFVERKSGCSDMFCRCRTKFCYDCGSKRDRYHSCRESRRVRRVR